MTENTQERRRASEERRRRLAALTVEQADAQFDCAISELRAMRDRFVLEGDATSLETLAQNLQAETW